MAVDVIMPRQGQSVESCIITQWHKSKGDKVSTGELLFSYETDKAAFDEEAKEDGVILEIKYEEGDEVPVLEPVAVIGKEGESVTPAKNDSALEESETRSDADPSVKSDQKEKIADADQSNIKGKLQTQGKVKISPLARKIARQLGVDFSDLSGTGPYGRIIKTDIENAAEKGEKHKSVAGIPVSGQASSDLQSSSDQQVSSEVTESTGDYQLIQISNLRKIIAERMHQSLTQSAQLTHHLSADARKLLNLKNEFKAKNQQDGSFPKITVNDMVCYAVIKALKKNKGMNAHFQGDSIKQFHSVHLGIAVDTPRGLMVPVVRNADDFNLEGLSKQLFRIAKDCREGKISPDLLSSEAGTFTVSNLGSFGIEMFTPVLNLPQTGILGVNTITRRPADTGDGTIGFVPCIGLSLTYDHRAVDGAPASAFLRDIKEEIENL